MHCPLLAISRDAVPRLVPRSSERVQMTAHPFQHPRPSERVHWARTLGPDKHNGRTILVSGRPIVAVFTVGTDPSRGFSTSRYGISGWVSFGHAGRCPSRTPQAEQTRCAQQAASPPADSPWSASSSQSRQRSGERIRSRLPSGVRTHGRSCHGGRWRTCWRWPHSSRATQSPASSCSNATMARCMVIAHPSQSAGRRRSLRQRRLAAR